MDELLGSLRGKKVELFCGASSMFSGVLEAIENGYVTIKDVEDRVVYVSKDKVIAVRESFEHQSRPGFIGK